MTALNAQAPLPALIWSEGLSQACFDHVLEQGPIGTTGHNSPDGTTFDARILRYVTNSGIVGENIAYNNVDTGDQMISQLLIDDGVSGRGHRLNIMNTDYTHVGISCGCHTTYGEM